MSWRSGPDDQYNTCKEFGEEAKEVCYAEGYKYVCVLGRRGESRALARRGLTGKQHGENEAQENYKTQRQIKDHLKRAVKTRTTRESRVHERDGEVMNVVYALDIVSMRNICIKCDVCETNARFGRML